MAQILITLKVNPSGETVISEETVEMSFGDHDWDRQRSSISNTFDCKGLTFVEFPPGYTDRDRVLDCPRIVFCLAGQMKLEVPSGDFRILQAGDVLKVYLPEPPDFSLSIVGKDRFRCAVAM